MTLRKFLPGFLNRRKTIEDLREKISGARECLAEAMTEECELRANRREVLEAVLERIGNLQRKADLLKVQAEFLGKRISEGRNVSAENEKFWKRKKEKINREYEQAYRKSRTRKKKDKGEQTQKKKSRLKKIWKKLLKLFPDFKFTPLNEGLKQTYDWFSKNYRLARK